jgi:MFS family permease
MISHARVTDPAGPTSGPSGLPEGMFGDSRDLLRAVLGATFFVRFAFGLTISIFAAFIVGHSSSLSLSEVGLVGLVTAAAPIGEFSTVLLSGLHADRYGRGPVLLAGMAGSLLLFVLISFTRVPSLLGVANLLFGVSSGAILAASLAAIGDAAAVQSRGWEMGRFDAVNLLGWVLGFAVGFAVLGLVPNGELPWVFRLGAVLLVAGFLFAGLELRRVNERPRHPSFSLAEIRDALLRREVLLVTLPWLTIYLLLGAGFVYLGSAASTVGVPPVELGALIGGGGLLLLLTQPTFGRFADRYGRLRLMIVGTLGFLGLLACVGVIAVVGVSPIVLALTGASALAALAYGPAALAALTDLSHQINRATTMALYSLVVSVGMLLGLAGVSSLTSAFGTDGILLFLAVTGTTLGTLTALRTSDVLRARRALTTPAR